MMLEVTLRVTSIRSQSPSGRGGCIFAGKPITDQGQVVDAGAYCVVKANAAVLCGATVHPGQWWKVAGEAGTRVLDVNGYQVAETQIDVSEAVMLRPSGEHLVTFMAESPAFQGIGQVKARKLWETFGNSLYDLLDDGDVTALSTVLATETAIIALAAWAQHGDSRTLQWLQAQGFDLLIGRKVLQFFGAETPEKLAEDPYRLLSFCGTWRQVDRLARTHFGIAPDDPRRLQGAIEEACYRIFAAGHTAALSSTLMDYLQGVLGSQTTDFPWRGLIPAALSCGLSNGSFVIGHHGVQPLGALVMERQVAKAVADRLMADVKPLLPPHDVDALLRRYEAVENIELNSEQRRAVQLAADLPFTLITGGAGVGKTTVLKALYEVFDCAGVAVTQLALAGRAAKRMQEATGRPASTIANFLRNWTDGGFTGDCVVVVDEASMVDIISMSRLCSLLPLSVRLVLVGDPAQLMPVGPGLVLHALTQVPEVPLAELKVVKRYGGDIAAAADAIRGGRWPELSDAEAAAIAFIPCPLSGGPVAESLPETVVRLYRADPADTQILCARRGGLDGSRSLNALCQAVLAAGAQPVKAWSDEHAQYAHTGLRLGDRVLCTRNLWDRGLQNGSLGVIVQVEDEPRPIATATGEGEEFALAWVEWDDGVRRPVVEEMLDDLELGYAITVHKAQGSQWPRVIVPVTRHRLLDRTLLYTAVTRAQRQVILIGDEDAVREATANLPRAQARQVMLDLTLAAMLEKHPEAPVGCAVPTLSS